jgi:hypothetical protein
VLAEELAKAADHFAAAGWGYQAPRLKGVIGPLHRGRGVNPSIDGAQGTAGDRGAALQGTGLGPGDAEALEDGRRLGGQFVGG